MPETIGEWDSAQLMRFVVNQLRTTSPQLFKELRLDELKASKTLTVEDKLELSPRALKYLKKQMGPVFDVTTFGADPSGSTDSTPFIQEAVDAAKAAGGGIVFFPRGIYLVSTQGSASGLVWAILVTSDNITLAGEGSASIIRATSDTTLIFADGAAVPEGAASWNDHWITRPSGSDHPIYSISSATAGATSITLSSAPDAANFAVGDYVLIRTGQTITTASEQPDAEINRVTAIVGAVLSLERPLAKAYAAENYPTGHASAGSPVPWGVQNFRVSTGRALLQNFTMRNLRFEKTTGTTNLATHISQADVVTIENCEISAPIDGFTTSRVRDYRASRNRVELTDASWRWGFSVDTSCSDAWINDNVIQSKGAGFIHVHEGPSRVKIRDNVILNKGITGDAPAIDIRNRAYDIEVSGNTITNCGDVGSAIYADSNSTGGGLIIGNRVYAPSLAGVALLIQSSGWTVKQQGKMVPNAVSLGNYPGNVSGGAGPQPKVAYSTWVTYTDKTPLFGSLPLYFVVTSVRIYVTVAFNSSGTNLLRVGVPASDQTFALDVNVASTGEKATTNTWGFQPVLALGDYTLKATYTNGGTAPTAGRALVVVEGYNVAVEPA